MNVVDLAARVTLAAVLLVAVASKARSRSAAREFATSLAPLVRAPRAWAALVVAAEAGTAALLVAPATSRAGLAAAALMLLVYAGAVARALRRDVPVTCRCFGAGGGSLDRAAVVRNVVLAAIAVAALGADGLLSPAPGPQLLIAGAVGAVGALVVVRWDDLRFIVGGIS